MTTSDEVLESEAHNRPRHVVYCICRRNSASSRKNNSKQSVNQQQKQLQNKTTCGKLGEWAQLWIKKNVSRTLCTEPTSSGIFSIEATQWLVTERPKGKRKRGLSRDISRTFRREKDPLTTTDKYEVQSWTAFGRTRNVLINLTLRELTRRANDAPNNWSSAKDLGVGTDKAKGTHQSKSLPGLVISLLLAFLQGITHVTGTRTAAWAGNRTSTVDLTKY